MRGWSWGVWSDQTYKSTPVRGQWICSVIFAMTQFWGGHMCLPAICLPSQSVIVGEVGHCVVVLCWQVVDVGVLRTGPVEAAVLVYSSVGHL